MVTFHCVTCARYFCATVAICKVSSAVLPPCTEHRVTISVLKVHPPTSDDNLRQIRSLDILAPTDPHVTSIKSGSREAMRSIRMYLKGAMR